MMSMRTRQIALLASHPKYQEGDHRDYARIKFAIERWPDVIYPGSRGFEVVDRCEDWGAAAVALTWGFPQSGLTPGNDYPNNVHYIKVASGLPGDHVFSDAYPTRELVA